jgi:hypothetical protein
MPRIMIIRHGEKHNEASSVHGVNIEGVRTKHELTVRGWLRAGALVPFFAHPHGMPEASPISTPRTIFASAATRHSPSLRPQHTVKPLAEKLGIQVDARHTCGEEAALATAALASAGPVLIVWHHSHIREIVRLITDDGVVCPADWPEDRFDLVWILDRSDAPGESWIFTQVAQRLLPNDRVDVL